MFFNKIKKAGTTACMCAAFMLLSACGSDNSDLETYKENMNHFFDTVSDYNDRINSADTSTEEGKQEILKDLDGLNEAFQEMATYEIPEEFQSLSDLATESADYMKDAVETYHLAYDGEYDEDERALADQYYERAGSRLQYMITILHGEIPEGEGVVVTTEDTYSLPTVTEDEEQENTDGSENEASTSEENQESAPEDDLPDDVVQYLDEE